MSSIPRRLVLSLLALMITLTGSLALTGCTAIDNLSMKNKPDQVATDLAKGLAGEDVSALELAGVPAAEANKQLATLTDGMDDDQPTVTVSSVNKTDDTATVQLSVSWKLAGQAKAWTYISTAKIIKDGNLWKADWSPTIVHPELSPQSRLVEKRTQAHRGEIVDTGNSPIVTERDVWRVGLDKTAVGPDQQSASAKALAKLVKIDESTYAAKVKGAGQRAFVEAIAFRADAKQRPTESELKKIKGASALTASQMLAPTREFARSIIGTVGEASKEIVDKSKGTVLAGDQVGLSGLQKRYDQQLRGTAGVSVSVVPTTSATPSPTASPSTETSPSADPSPASSPKVVYESKPIDGEPLTVTLNPDLQSGAESILAKVKPASSIVAIKPSTGEVLVAANGPGSGDQPTATTGQYPPGSTFKVATSLALLRSGLKPDSAVTCPETVNVDGKSFKNYSDYPSNHNGKIDLRTAVAQSCNTAFIGQRDRLKSGDLAAAAASLGVGTDYDVGFPAYFGSVPADKTQTGRAAAMIGQGKVQASPLAMAGVAASVSHGKTVLPTLVKGQQATSKAEPLTKTEAKQLKEMMRAVVTDGSGGFLANLSGGDVIAKTGTAEYGAKEPFKTHAWMIAAQGDLAVAVFVGDGESGSATAGPLLKKFLQQAH